ncbi:MAG: sugar phosphate isomerase/epimerase [Chloroflexota bacterium]
MRVGCQTYTWQMLGDAWRGTMGDVLDAIAAAGFAGVETTWQMLGPLLDNPERFGDMLARRGLSLAALALSPPTGWSDPSAEAAELALADRAIEFLSALGLGGRLGLGGGRAPSRAQYREKFDQMIRMYHAVARRAVDRGLVVHVHPTSTDDSLLLVGAEYQMLVDRLDPALVGLGPDTAHITRGDERALDFVRRNARRITHIHLKDAFRGGDYATMGTADAEIEAVAAFLRDFGYTGWLIAEEESDSAGADPATSVRSCRAYLAARGF